MNQVTDQGNALNPQTKEEKIRPARKVNLTDLLQSNGFSLYVEMFKNNDKINQIVNNVQTKCTNESNQPDLSKNLDLAVNFIDEIIKMTGKWSNEMYPALTLPHVLHSIQRLNRQQQLSEIGRLTENHYGCTNTVTTSRARKVQDKYEYVAGDSLLSLSDDTYIDNVKSQDESSDTDAVGHVSQEEQEASERHLVDDEPDDI